jgi:DNA-binding protein Fis
VPLEPLEAPMQLSVEFLRPASPQEVQPSYTLTFGVGTSMKEIHDAIINSVLQFTGGNRLVTAEMLEINPRTIRRRVGRKYIAGRGPGASGSRIPSSRL